MDKQEDIYKGNASLGIQSLFDLVRDGIKDLDATSTVKPGADDLIYGGDLAKWKRAGNTLLLKFATTISRKEPALATSVINEVLTGNNYINANSGDMNFTFGASVGSQDPRFTYTAVSTFKDDIILSTRYLTLLNSLNDPRLPIFFTKPAANYVTIDNGFRAPFLLPLRTGRATINT
ncbi:SusD/RagB family nutrient-binding outer membrane lipoprotein [Spirosoma telluris]|uniref:SusD/RagB family nutrient-binding outer membrane lipoprotein n=1 Tax=Spirosoma telluris TaxID=2183553 RepID=UPI002FC347AE